MSASLVGSEMCIRDSPRPADSRRPGQTRKGPDNTANGPVLPFAPVGRRAGCCTDSPGAQLTRTRA
eukprot:10377320-Alexandrium_andersonii.AAC.1